MTQSFLESGEKVILNSHGAVTRPISGHGRLYLTDRRLLLVHRSGLVKVKETPVLDIGIPQISFSKIEGMLRRSLVLGVKSGNGQVVSYKIRVNREEKWSLEINALKGSAESVALGFPGLITASGDEFCGRCGEQTTSYSKYCSNCGESLY